MDEEFRDEELERKIKEVTDNLNRKLENKLFLLKDGINKKEPFISVRPIDNNRYYIEIHSPYMGDDFYIRELGDLLKYAKEKGYFTNLD